MFGTPSGRLGNMVFRTVIGITIVAGPSAEAREAGTQKKELAERHILRREFWTQLLEQAKQKTQLHARRSPGPDNWVSAGAGKSGLSYVYTVRMEDTEVALSIDRGAAEENARIFGLLNAYKEEIERVFGEPLKWRPPDEKSRAGAITFKLEQAGGLRDHDYWPQIQAQMIDAMVRLERALKAHIQELR
jgi:hypothetical protein